MNFKPALIISAFFLLCQCGGENTSNLLDKNAKETSSEAKENMVDPSSKVVGEKDQLSVPENIDLKTVEEELPNTYMDPFDPDFISGKWEAEDYDEVSFGTWFYVEDGYVSGQYCAMKVDASRIDCGTHDEVDMCYTKSKYLVGSKKLELDIVSCYSLKKGKATIEPYGDGDLLWTLTEAPGKYGVDHFAPETAVLRKTHFDPWE